MRDVGGKFQPRLHAGAVQEGGAHAPRERGSLKPSMLAPTWYKPGSKHRRHTAEVGHATLIRSAHSGPILPSLETGRGAVTLTLLPGSAVYFAKFRGYLPRVSLRDTRAVRGSPEGETDGFDAARSSRSLPSSRSLVGYLGQKLTTVRTHRRCRVARPRSWRTPSATWTRPPATRRPRRETPRPGFARRAGGQGERAACAGPSWSRNAGAREHEIQVVERRVVATGRAARAGSSTTSTGG